MIRTQIQLPDEVYARARRVAEAREISFAELARRGLEYILSVYVPEGTKAGDWHPPKPRHLGWKRLTEDQLKAQARLSTAEAALSRKR
jgi:hypothetical protein